MGVPFFSIGLTTYSRPVQLREAVDSILSQSFQDFEIIIGNDCVDEVISRNNLGGDGFSMRIINHSTNLGEMDNMNFLMREAKGKYFTWLSDDDLYHPRFLEEVYQAICKHAPDCVYTNYETQVGLGKPHFKVLEKGCVRHEKGADFFHGYLMGRYRAMGCNSVYRLEALKKIGGMESLCGEKVGLYGEYMLLVHGSTFPHVCYLDLPLAIYRSHSDSAVAHMPLDAFATAGVKLLERSLRVMAESTSRPFYFNDFYCLARMCYQNYYNRATGDFFPVPPTVLLGYARSVHFILPFPFIFKNWAAHFACFITGLEVAWSCLKSWIRWGLVIKKKR